MAKLKTQSKKKKKIEVFQLSLSAFNYIVIGIGILFIIIGYVFLSENSVDGFMPTVVAPIILVLGYCVIIPLGILMNFGKKEKTENITELKEDETPEITNTVVSGPSANVKVH
jgi:membrane protein CcdC involved in cytochrome C biogenesis